MTRFRAPPHTSQVDGPSSNIEWITSMRLPQLRHS
jgi:hypothetical protein